MKSKYKKQKKYTDVKLSTPESDSIARMIQRSSEFLNPPAPLRINL